MSSTSDSRDPKPSVVTGFPTTTAAPYYVNPDPNPNPTYNGYYQNPNPNYNGYYQNPNPNYNGYYENPNPNYNRNLFLRRILAFVVAVFLIIGAVTFIIWLVLRPKLPDFSISKFSVSNFNLSLPNSLSSQFDLDFTVRNPNSKMSVYYDLVTAAIVYDDDSLSETKLAPFYQKTGDVMGIKARLVTIGEYVSDDVVNGFRLDKKDGVVRFGVRILSVVRFKAGVWRTRTHLLRVFCDGIEIGFKNAKVGVGEMMGPARVCQVGLVVATLASRRFINKYSCLLLADGQSRFRRLSS